jgi:hypothetical protein
MTNTLGRALFPTTASERERARRAGFLAEAVTGRRA